MKKLKVFEAFAGYGSQSIALKNIGVDYEVIGISEINRYALIGYDILHNKNENILIPSIDEMIKDLLDANICFDFKSKTNKIPKKYEDLKRLYIAHKRSKNLGDISKISTDNIPDHDLFTYSFPCTDISTAGKMLGINTNTRSGLLYECKKIIEVKKPKYLLLENVKNLVNSKFKNDFNAWLDYLSSLGYKNFWKVLNSKDFNIPQNRLRVFVLSILDNNSEYKFPDPIPLTRTINDYIDINENNYKYINSKKIRLEEKYWFNKEIQTGAMRGRKDIDGVFRQRIELRKDLCSNTITTVKKDNIIVYKNKTYRYMTPKECGLLMGLNNNQVELLLKEISESNLYILFGNSIVIPVLEEIFLNIF